MVDIGLSHVLEDYAQTQAQKKCLYLKAYTSIALSSALSTEITNKVEMEYGWPKRANLL
jgi:succinate dehydrogenase hydrophobic anchor subunit